MADCGRCAQRWLMSRRCGPHPPGSAAVKGLLCDRGGIGHKSQCSLVRRASRSCHEAGSPAGSVEGREQFCGGFRGPVDLVEALTFPGLSWSLGSFSTDKAKSASHGDLALPGTCQPQGRGTWGGWMGLARESRAVPEDENPMGESLLPVILKLSASHIWEVLLNTSLLDGL